MLVACVVAAANPVNGWVFSLITIVLVTLPMTLTTVIVQNVQARRSKPDSAVNAVATQAPEGENAAQLAEVPAAPLRAKDFKIRGFIHLSLGIGVLTLAIVNLVIAQTLPLWTKMLAEPFWCIIAFCSSVSFVLASTNFSRAK